MDSANRQPKKCSLVTRHCVVVTLCALTIGVAGCSSSRWIKLRSVPTDPLSEPLRLMSWYGPRPTARTEQWLRRYDLVEYLDDPSELYERAQLIVNDNRSAENVYVLAELAYIAGKQAESSRQEETALDMYWASVANAYFYLFDEQLDSKRNPYDPQFRSACDLYNGALESSMRIAKARGLLTIGGTQTVQTATQSFNISMVSRGGWSPEDIEQLEFVSDYDLQGLTNHYRTFGLGVPLIAVYSRDSTADPAAEYYAPGMSVPVTAFLRVVPEHERRRGHNTHECELEFYNPIATSNIRIGRRRVPLQTDITTPLAYSLNDPQLQKVNAPTRGLLDVQRSSEVQGLYMLEPYDPYKIPVLMVHGIWSSAITWMEMFNDLRGDPRIRDNYQFWFYLYPTGQPFWISATQLRGDLQTARSALDPHQQSSSLEQMVLVGHSMGGLLAKMQAIESGDDFLRLVTDQDITDLDVEPDVRAKLQKALYFHPDPSVRRVVTIATPHRGSNFSNRTTQWLGRRLIHLPDMVEQNIDNIVRNNRNLIRKRGVLQIRTSIESLAPDSPVLPVVLAAKRAPWVKYHNVVGRLADEGVVGRVAGDSDGIVRAESARLDDADSQIEVPADHTSVHQHPKTVLELQRILLSHLAGRSAKFNLSLAGAWFSR